VAAGISAELVAGHAATFLGEPMTLRRIGR
jgi:hypothetical protein